MNKQIVIIILVGIFSFWPTYEAFNAIRYLGDDLNKTNYYATSYFFREAIQGRKDVRNYTYLCGEYDMHWRLYTYRLNDLGSNITCVPYWDNPHFNPGDKVVANVEKSKALIESNYQYRLLEDFYGVRSYLITGKK